MRKLVVSNIASLDGYHEGPSKNVMDLFDCRFGAYPADDSFDAYNAERLRAAGTLLLGRASYEGSAATSRPWRTTPTPRPSCGRCRASTTS